MNIHLDNLTQDYPFVNTPAGPSRSDELNDALKLYLKDTSNTNALAIVA
jgi:hypothetical protein